MESLPPSWRAAAPTHLATHRPHKTPFKGPKKCKAVPSPQPCRCLSCCGSAHRALGQSGAQKQHKAPLLEVGEGVWCQETLQKRSNTAARLTAAISSASKASSCCRTAEGRDQLLHDIELLLALGSSGDETPPCNTELPERKAPRQKGFGQHVLRAPGDPPAPPARYVLAPEIPRPGSHLLLAGFLPPNLFSRLESLNCSQPTSKLLPPCRRCLGRGDVGPAKPGAALGAPWTDGGAELSHLRLQHPCELVQGEAGWQFVLDLPELHLLHCERKILREEENMAGVFPHHQLCTEGGLRGLLLQLLLLVPRVWEWDQARCHQ